MDFKNKLAVVMLVASLAVGTAAAQSATTDKLDSDAIVHNYPSDGATVLLQEDGDELDWEVTINYSEVDTNASSLDYSFSFTDGSSTVYTLDSGTRSDLTSEVTYSGTVTKSTLNTNNISSSVDPVYFYTGLDDGATTVTEENTSFTITNDQYDYLFNLMVGILGILIVLGVFSELF